MVGTSHKSKQDGPAGSSHDDLASHGNEEHQAQVCTCSGSFMFFLYITDFVFHFLFIFVVSIFQPRSSAPITRYKRMRTKAIVSRGKRPDDIISNENSNESQAADAGNKNVEGADVDQPPKPKC